MHGDWCGDGEVCGECGCAGGVVHHTPVLPAVRHLGGREHQGPAHQPGPGAINDDWGRPPVPPDGGTLNHSYVLICWEWPGMHIRGVFMACVLELTL